MPTALKPNSISSPHSTSEEKKKAQKRAQQKTVQAQRLHPCQIVGIAGLAHPFAKARLLAELLDDAHAVDHFVEAIVDVGKPGAHRRTIGVL